MEVGLGPSHIVLDGDPAPLPKKGTDPHPTLIFGPVYCRQMAGYIKMPLGMEVSLRPRRLCVRWGPSNPQNRGHTHYHPVFGPCLLWPNGWMDEDATWYGSRPRPRPHCIRRGSCSVQNGHSGPHLVGPCLLWPRSPISATAELL